MGRVKVTTEPLDWPPHLERTTPARRSVNARRVHFRTTVLRAAQQLYEELSKLKARHVRVTGDLCWRNDGLPYADQRGGDPGVAIFCEVDNETQTYACDLYPSAAENMRALGRSLESIRAVRRYGALWGQVRSGLRALPPSTSSTMTVNEAIKVLELDRVGFSASKPPPREVFEPAFKLAVAVHHPDRGGDPSKMARVNEARRLLVGISESHS